MMGERLGKWTLSTEIGRGGMGRVFLAQEDVSHRQAAVKILAAELATDAGFLNRFQREIEALSQLSHPHIVQFIESGNDAGKYYYVMEYVAGKSLEEIVEDHGRLGWRETLEIALQVCPALKHVHDHGIIHRDLKLSNILVRDDGIVKLTDFGIAKVFSNSHLTQTGGVVGTAEYLSPEQAMGKPVTKKSDIYSLGVVLYCLLTGRLPFEGTGFLELLHKHRYAQFDRPAKIAHDLPYEIDEIICQMLEKDPAKRPPDCLVLAKQIDAVRMKFERKDQATHAGTADTVAQTKAVFNPQPSAGPITMAERLGKSPSSREGGGLVGRVFNHPLVILVLLAVCVGVIAIPFLPASQATLYQRGAELMKSDRLSDIEEGWREYLEPLSRNHPDNPYQDEIERYRQKWEAARNPSEAARLLGVANRKFDEGDAAGAAMLWRDLIAAFDETDPLTVQRARDRLAAASSRAAQAEKLRQVRPALDRAAAMKNREAAERILTAIENLYRNDPGGGMILEEISRQRK